MAFQVQSDTRRLHHLDRLIDAIDIWNDWNSGQTIAHTSLLNRVDALVNVAARPAARAVEHGEVTGVWDLLPAEARCHRPGH
jgi:hypothetical protein